MDTKEHLFCALCGHLLRSPIIHMVQIPIILPENMSASTVRLDDFLKNPVVLEKHNMSILPLGRAHNVRWGRRGLVADVRIVMPEHDIVLSSELYPGIVMDLGGKTINLLEISFCGVNNDQ